MKIFPKDLMDEINSYFQCEWEEYSYRSDKVRAIKTEMDELVELLLKANETARYNESHANSMVGIKAELQKKKHALIDAINEAKATQTAESTKEKAHAQEKRRIELAEEANSISKRSQKLSRISIGISAAIGVLSIGTQIYLNLSKEERIKAAVTSSVAETTVNPLKQELQTLKSKQDTTATAVTNVGSRVKIIEDQRVTEELKRAEEQKRAELAKKQRLKNKKSEATSGSKDAAQ